MLKEQFKSFFERHDTFTIGVCNGCQMLSGLKSIIPGSDSFPKFKQNQSEVFESRLCMVEIMKSKSIFLNSMEGSVLIIPVAHGEGRVDIESDGCCMRYVDGTKGGSTIVCYPLNPNGSVKGQTGFSSKDGRCLILMPHPERYISCTTHTWKTNHAMKLESGAWMKLFENAREWVEQWL